MPRLVAIALSTVALASCCSFPSHARINAGTQQLCAKHHVPLIAARGFSYGSERPVLIYYKGYKHFQKIEESTPNRIDDLESLTHQGDITKPTLVTYCRRCEAEFQERWNGPIVSMNQLVGRWRHVKTGLVTTIEPDGRARGIGYDGKLWVGRWKILHRGVISTSYAQQKFTHWHTIVHIERDYFLDRADSPLGDTDKFVRVQ